jgi:hypothetical protein
LNKKAIGNIASDDGFISKNWWGVESVEEKERFM